MITRLAPLVTIAGLASAVPTDGATPAFSGQLAPVVLPQDIVDPARAAAILESQPEASTAAIKGGVPLRLPYRRLAARPSAAALSAMASE